MSRLTHSSSQSSLSSVSTESSIAYSSTSSSSSSYELYQRVAFASNPPLRCLSVEGGPEDDILRWLEELESRFVALCVQPAEWVDAALCFLNGVVRELMDDCGKSWNEFREKLLRIYNEMKAAPHSTISSLRRRFTQAGASVAEFHAEKLTQVRSAAKVFSTTTATHAATTMQYTNEKLSFAAQKIAPPLSSTVDFANEKISSAKDTISSNIDYANEKIAPTLRTASTNIHTATNSVQKFRSTHATAINSAAVGLVVVGSSILIPAVGVAALGAAGFGSNGVVAGSLAASAQSAIYGGATAGVFSVLQSAGATAVAASVPTVVGGATALVAGLGGLFVPRGRGGV